jgi:hypothetical protein
LCGIGSPQSPGGWEAASTLARAPSTQCGVWAPQRRPAHDFRMDAHHHYHALVWLDHREARIFHFNPNEAERETVRSTHPNQHIHHKSNTGDSGHAPVDNEYLKHVTAALIEAGAILITGPANAKTELASYIHQHHPELAKRISGVEPLDHPTDGELLNKARSFFKADDRMHSQKHR